MDSRESGSGLRGKRSEKPITSRKGTTEAAIRALDEHGFPAAVKAAYRANKARSRELAEGR